MSRNWISDIGVGQLPEPFAQMVDAMEADIMEVLPEIKKAKAARLAHICMLSMMAECEGEEIYFPKHDGDKLCELRHDLIRSGFRKAKASSKNPIRHIVKKFGLSTRTIRSVLKDDHENQRELFKEEGQEEGV